MTGYTVVIDELRKSSNAAADLSTRLKAVDLHSPAAHVALALPGTSAGPALTGLGDLWQAVVQSISDSAARYAHDLTAAADVYSANEEAAKRDFRTAGMRPV